MITDGDQPVEYRAPFRCMELFVYEHVTATVSREAADPLWAEASAMLDAVTSDLAELDGVEVVTGFADRFDELAAACDGVLLIAPESGGVLASLADRVERLGGRLLSPSKAFCEWATDKSRVAAALQGAGVPVPHGVLVRQNDPWPNAFPLPAVLKPNDGCGSQGIILLPSGEGARRADEGRLEWVTTLQAQSALTPALSRREREYRLEQFVPGVAASVALLRGPAGVFPLPACSQRLADDGSSAYLGGRCPLPESLAARAETLARRAAAAMPEWRGYVGVDLVLGPADDGSQDYVIEVNPRLTTSYVGLRALSETNLAKAMLDVIAGRVPALAWRDAVVEFDADGAERSAETSPAAKS